MSKKKFEIATSFLTGRPETYKSKIEKIYKDGGEILHSMNAPEKTLIIVYTKPVKEKSNGEKTSDI